MMRALIGVAVFAAIGLVAMPSIAVGQELTSGYAFVGPVLGFQSVPVAWDSGGGVDRWIGGAVGIGGEIENIYLPEFNTHHGCCAWSSGPSEAFWLLAVKGTLYLARSTSGPRPKWDPFVTAGIGFIQAELGVVNFGGGVDRWITHHAGVRFEIQSQQIGGALLGLHAGVVFR
jgi:hypothetical protein